MLSCLTLVSHVALSLALREVRKLLVGTTDFGPSGNENDINAWSALPGGKRVVRLKSGDRNVQGRKDCHRASARYYRCGAKRGLELRAAAR
jgi:siroheme synthase